MVFARIDLCFSFKAFAISGQEFQKLFKANVVFEFLFWTLIVGEVVTYSLIRSEVEDEEEEADDEFKEAFEECCILDSSGSETLVARGVGGSSVLVEDEAMDDIDE